MSTSIRHRFANFVQSALLIACITGVAWLIVSSLAGPQVTTVVLVATLVSLLLAPSLPRAMALQMARARRMSSADFPQGVAIVSMLAPRADLPTVPALYYSPNPQPNAFAVGSPDDSAICITDGLLRLLGPRELAGVLAHEISHIAHRDLWLLALTGHLSRLVSMASWVGQLIVLINLPLLLSGAAMIPWQIPLLLIASPSVVALLQLALSRTREYDADRGAVELTGESDGLISALAKMERANGRWWETLFGPGGGTSAPSLFRTHPSTEDRIRRLRALNPTRHMAGPWGEAGYGARAVQSASYWPHV